MVLFKRKPVQPLAQPTIEDDSTEVWVIPETGEVFTTYDAYLQRTDFYKQKRFICEITGHSAQTFFDALKSETEGSREVDSAFPDALREPVLRRVQFSTVTRIDNLVDQVFEEFKNDFYPGERVTCLVDDGQRLHSVVREKAKFPEILNSDGTIKRKAFSRYFVTVLNGSEEEALMDEEHLVRDRKTFTKQMLRSFLKSTISREAWTGAPWLVKPQIARDYRIDSTVPPHLQYGNKLAEKKASLAMKKNDIDGQSTFWASKDWPQLQPRPKGQKNSRYSAQELASIEEQQYIEFQRASQGKPTWAISKPGPSPSEPQFMNMHGNTFPGLQSLAAKASPKPAPPPAIKYPIEDLDVGPVRDGTHRPSLKLLSSDSPMPSWEGAESSISMESVGPLLETWNTLNVYCQVFQIDSFTFDDFVEAMQFSSDNVDCELFIEIHCAILKKVVNSEDDQNGMIQVSLPELPSEESDEEESGPDSSRLPTPTPEPEMKPAGRSTRSSLRKSGLANVQNADDVETTALEEVKLHRAAEMFDDDYGWVQRLRKRDFKNGGWQLIMVGLLHQLAGRPRMAKVCEELLKHLAPLDAEPTQETARLQYNAMDMNMRVKALQIICMLTLETKMIKTYLEECSLQMTEFRKEKIEHQRARKQAIEDLRLLNEERKILQPETAKSPTPPPVLKEEPADVEMAELEDSDQVVDTEDEEPLTGRSLRRGNDRAAERKRKKEQEKERKERAEAAKQTKGVKQYNKVLKKIEEQKQRIKDEEEAIAIVDNDLREADCPRTRVLGKDRFWNRYYWFERNAMPFEGLPDSSTADAEYANGRIWVQGPDDLEREGFIDLPEEQHQDYYRRFQLTPAERKRAEEGLTSVFTAHQWGYYDDPDSLEMLIGWLDVRGVRELKLRKELQAQRENIAKYMEKRKEYLLPREESEELPATRMSTRTKTHVSDINHRCLRWKNETALNANGHRHSEQPPKSNKRKKPAEDARETRTTNRRGKPLTRQGSRYEF